MIRGLKQFYREALTAQRQRIGRLPEGCGPDGFEKLARAFVDRIFALHRTSRLAEPFDDAGVAEYMFELLSDKLGRSG